MESSGGKPQRYGPTTQILVGLAYLAGNFRAAPMVLQLTVHIWVKQ